MEFIQSYNVKLINPEFKLALINTINLYREAVAFLIDIFNKEWTNLEPLTGKNRNNFAEKLVHSTNKNIATYDFDDKFNKFPSYLRRCAIQDALGIVSSYRSNLNNYELDRYEAISNGKKFKKKAPSLSLKHFKCPAFYKGNMYERLNEDIVQLKLFIKNDWVYKTFKLRQQDINYINKKCSSLKECSPLLVRKGRNFYLSYSFKGQTTLNKTRLKDQKILAVDLGLNKSAVCSIISYDGTVHKRLFINQKREKDHQNILINRLKVKQRLGGRFATNKSLWSKINGLNTHITNDTVNKIITFATENKVDVIVFEYLDFTKRKKVYGKNNIASRLHLWCQRTIQSKVEDKAHAVGIRVNRINPKNTSALAFDGSGYVKRDKFNHSLCTFTTGKQYNCDLNASYNIGARYYIKEIKKAISKKKWADVVAKVPQLSTRTKCTLSTLIGLVVEL